MSFRHIADLLRENFENKTKNGESVFQVNVDKDKLWDIYLSSFPEGTNPIYRVNTVHDCSCCRHFLKKLGGAVFIGEDLKPHTIFEFEIDDPEYEPVMKALDEYVKTCPVTDAFFSKERELGQRLSRERGLDGKVIEYDHFNIELPSKLVSDDVNNDQAEIRDTKHVFMRSLTEISLEAIDTVLELISSNALYRGTEWEGALKEFRKHKVEFSKLDDADKDAYCWKNAASVGFAIGRIRNHSIGTLLVNISNDMDLDEAVRQYEVIVAPTNYKRPKAIFTKKMLEDAQKKVEELGYMESLPRRFAKMDDVTVNNILFANRETTSKLGGSVFDSMKEELPVNPKQFSRVDEVGIEDFVNNVLPTAKEVEAFVEGRLRPNMVSLIAPVNKDAKSMFKWNNGFSWAYAGNIADSDIQKNVKAAGGNIEGVLRFSIQWNDTSEWDENDLDAHCTEPDGHEIYFGNKISWSGGNLDVDIIQPKRNTPAVENIVFPSLIRMKDGDYLFYVHCYSNRSGRSGFRAELEVNGEIYSYDYDKPLRQNEKVIVGIVTLNKGQFTYHEKLKSTVSSREIWGVKSNQFVPVNMIMYSPNYWDDQNGIGNRHYMFMLKGCKNPDTPNGFYNEFLDNNLLEHKRVFEALGSKMSVEQSDDQLSGLGFSSTKRNELIVRVKGATQRVMRVKF